MNLPPRDLGAFPSLFHRGGWWRVWLVFLLAGGVFLVGCAARDSRVRIPPAARDLYVPPFRNRSNEIGLENLVTEAVLQQFLADGRLNIVEDPRRADVILRGVIRGYRRRPVIYDARDIVQQYRVGMTLRLWLLDPDDEESLREIPGLTRQTYYSDRVAPVETEEEAQQRVVEQLARDVVRKTLRGWPYVDGPTGGGGA